MDGLEKVIGDIRKFFNKYEAKWYSTEGNYLVETRRGFTKYWLEDVAGFYVMAGRKNMVKKYGLLYKHAGKNR